ncbi:MAG: hypothetical protein AAGF94_04795 [Pseudomonadota bacterium]
MIRIDEIRPLLQPIQVDPLTNAERPPKPEPVVSEEELTEAISLAEEATAELTSEDGVALVDEKTARLLENTLNQMQDAKDTHGKHSFHKFRRSLKNATYILGGLVAAIGSGVMLNLLTAPAAAQTLLARLQPVFEKILQFFF